MRILLVAEHPLTCKEIERRADPDWAKNLRTPVATIHTACERLRKKGLVAKTTVEVYAQVINPKAPPGTGHWTRKVDAYYATEKADQWHAN